MSSPDSDIQHLVEHSGITVPLAAAIIRLCMSSGASRLEIETALGLVGTLIPTLPLRLIDEGACSPDLLPSDS